MVLHGKTVKKRSLLKLGPCPTLLSVCVSWVLSRSHPNISIHILHTILYTFPLVLTRRIRSTIKAC